MEELDQLINKQKEKKITEIINPTNCQECPNLKTYKNIKQNNDTLYKCKKDYKETISTNIDTLYKRCPYNHDVEIKQDCVSRYVLKHDPDNQGDPYIEIEDWSNVEYEADGNNPTYEDAKTTIIAFYDNTNKEILTKHMIQIYKELDENTPYTPKKYMPW